MQIKDLRRQKHIKACAVYDDLIDVISYLFHVIEHTAFYYNASIMVDNAAVMLKL